MKSTEKGLTVGELTTFIAILIIAGLAWSTFKSKDESKENSSSIKALANEYILTKTNLS